jgi:hypothetical protein
MSELSGIVNLSYIDMNKIFESNLAKVKQNFVHFSVFAIKVQFFYFFLVGQ